MRKAICLEEDNSKKQMQLSETNIGKLGEGLKVFVMDNEIQNLSAFLKV